MDVQFALLLSSKNQAYLVIWDPTNVTNKRHAHLVISHDEAANLYTMGLHHVTYPHAQAGKGWGKPVVAAKPYKTCQFQGMGALTSGLESYGIDAKNKWLPVEEEEEEE